MQLKPFSLKVSALLLLTSICVFTGCDSVKPGIYGNEQIKSGKRDDFHQLNTTLLAELKANNPHELEGIMSQEFISDPGRLRNIEILSNHLKESEYSLLSEYYIFNDPSTKNTIRADKLGVNDHTIHYEAITNEIYIAQFIPKTGAVRYMITATYYKYNYGWKVSKLELEKYQINGKTAPELYKMAKEDYDKKYLTDAANLVALAQDCVSPCAGWRYPEYAEMDAFSEKVTNELNRKYRFPYAIRQVKTQPEIFRVLNQRTDEGVFPMIYYLTSIKLKDTIAVKRENENIKKVIGNVMPGINKNKKRVLYSAFNQMPDGTRAFDHFDMTDKLQK